MKRAKSMVCSAETARGKRRFFNCLNRDLKTDGGNFYIEEANGARRAVVAEDIGYVLSTLPCLEFLTGREFLKFFMDINEKSLKNPRSTMNILIP